MRAYDPGTIERSRKFPTPVGRRARVSANYTRNAGTNTFRQAAHVETPGFLLVDALRFELYERVGDDGNYGYNIYG